MASAAAGCAGRVGASYYRRRRAAGDGLSLVAPMVTVLPKIFELCMNDKKNSSICKPLRTVPRGAKSLDPEPCTAFIGSIVSSYSAIVLG